MYLYILVCYKSNFDRTIEFNIYYMILQLYTVDPHVCAKLHCQVMFLITFFLSQQVHIIHLYPPPFYIQMMYILKCCMLQFCDIALKFFYICFNIFFIHSNSYFLLNGVFLYTCCCIFFIVTHLLGKSYSFQIVILLWIYIFHIQMNVWYCCRNLSYLLCPFLYIYNLQYNVTQIVFPLLVLLGNLMQVSF